MKNHSYNTKNVCRACGVVRINSNGKSIKYLVNGKVIRNRPDCVEVQRVENESSLRYKDIFFR